MCLSRSDDTNGPSCIPDHCLARQQDGRQAWGRTTRALHRGGSALHISLAVVYAAAAFVRRRVAFSTFLPAPNETGATEGPSSTGRARACLKAAHYKASHTSRAFSCSEAAFTLIYVIAPTGFTARDSGNVINWRVF